METTDKYVARCLARLLWAHGVRHVVLSPGSRNAPLTVAIARHPGLSHYVINDERSAAFFALGLASHRGEPVAAVCTSGTAVLNYGPALAEAFYRGLPLIAVSADRPREWIDMLDSQTIRQPGALANVVKCTRSVDDCSSQRAISRDINEALIAATTGRPGPVHINIHLHEPLGGMTDVDTDEEIPVIRAACGDLLPPGELEMLAGEIERAGKVMIVAGCHLPDPDLTDALKRLSERGVAIVAEPVANVVADACVNHFDSIDPDVLGRLPRPELVITFGGPLVSKKLKGYLRGLTACRHWSVGRHYSLPDTFGHLERAVETDEARFFRALADHKFTPGTLDTAMSAAWAGAERIAAAPKGWDEQAAIRKIIDCCPDGYNLQLSNGMSIRHAMTADCRRFARVDANRGTSGIEGATSTAAGLQAIDKTTTTLLITGDMSAAYDIAALSNPYLTGRMKIVVVNNRGGGIFRLIESTRSLTERAECFESAPRFPVEGIATAYGFSYVAASTLMELEAALGPFFAEKESPALLELKF